MLIIMAVIVSDASASEANQKTVIKVTNLSTGDKLYSTNMTKENLHSINLMANEAGCKVVNTGTGIVSINCADSTITKRTGTANVLTADLKVDIPIYPADSNANEMTGVNYVQHNLGYTGEGVTIGIIDTGVDINHPELVGRVTGFNIAENNFDLSDNMDHGTPVTGTAIASGINPNAIGGAPNASVIIVKVFNSKKEATFANVGAGIKWLESKNVSVISISLSTENPWTWKTGNCDNFDENLTAIIHGVIANGTPIVVVAGNNGQDGDGIPACISGVIVVRAVDFDKLRPFWSSIGNQESISAPGVNMFATTAGGGYGYYSGTSFAAPQVATIIALMKQANSSLIDTTIKKAIYENADPLGSVSPNPEYGYGLINATKATNSILPKESSGGGITQINIMSQNSTVSTITKQNIKQDITVSNNPARRSRARQAK